MIEIDGSHGEGGGQIVRTALALSMVTGRPFRLHQLRAGRKKPGLRPQHLVAVQAATKIAEADVAGAAVGSQQLEFRPQSVCPGEYRFDIGTAGSVALVLQTVLPALLTAEASSVIQVKGGTHNPLAPPVDFFEQAFAPLVNRMGPQVDVRLERYGFYPAGGGQTTMRVRPVQVLRRLDLQERGRVKNRRVRALVANLPAHIARRECDWIARRSGWPSKCFSPETVDARGPGNVVLIELVCEHVTEVLTGFGQRGVPAERVAAAAWRAAEDYLASEVPVGPYLADQLLLPLAMSAQQGGGGSLRSMPLSGHAVTQLDILRRFYEDLTVETTSSERACNVRIGHP